MRTAKGTTVPAGIAMLFGLMALLVACSESPDERSATASGAETGDAAGGATELATGATRGEPKSTVVLGVTDWTAAQLNAAIAEQVIERRLGYPVETEDVLDTGEMLGDLASGDLAAVLEVWPSALEANQVEIIGAGTVEDLGELGVTGKTGWFVPRYVVDDNPELGTWEAFADRSVAAQFATAETGRNGRFLGTDTNYEQFDEQIIDELDVPFDVVFTGSDEATADELTRAQAAGDPVLLFWWTPTAEVVKFDLVNVALPERTAACEDDIDAGEPQRCDYPTDRLQKLGSPALSDEAPEVHRFLERFSLTTEDQLQMIDAVENAGRTVDDVAAEWIANNQDRWEGWLDGVSEDSESESDGPDE